MKQIWHGNSDNQAHIFWNFLQNSFSNYSQVSGSTNTESKASLSEKEIENIFALKTFLKVKNEDKKVHYANCLHKINDTVGVAPWCEYPMIVWAFFKTIQKVTRKDDKLCIDDIQSLYAFAYHMIEKQQEGIWVPCMNIRTDGKV